MSTFNLIPFLSTTPFLILSSPPPRRQYSDTVSVRQNTNSIFHQLSLGMRFGKGKTFFFVGVVYIYTRITYTLRSVP